MKKRILTFTLAVLMLVTLIPFTSAAAAEGADFTISDEGIAIIKKWEGFRSKPHWDYSQYTVGYGTRVPEGKLDEYLANGISEEEADALLRTTLDTTGKRVNSFLDKFGINATQGMFDMLVSISFNCGSAWLYETSTLRNAIVEGWTGNDLLFAVGQWSTAGGSTLPALVRRRLCEVNMYVNGVYSTSVPSNYCYVRFDPNGGSCEIKTQCYDSNTPAEIRAVPTYEGYTFEGWYTDATGGEKVTVLDAGVRNYMLYAHWSAGEGGTDTDSSAAITGTAVNYEREIAAELLHSFTEPVTGSLVSNAHKLGDIVTITHEYTDNSGITWGKIKDGGWINLSYTKLPGQAETEQTGGVKVTVTGTGVNIRRGPGTGYASVGTANKGDVLTITETAAANGHTWGKCDQGWIALTYTDYSAASAEEQKPDTEQTTDPEGETDQEQTTQPDTVIATGKVKLTSGVLNIRKGPSTGNAVVGSLKNGSAVEIYETKTVGTMEWGRIEKGWISLTYVVLDEKEPENTEEPEQTTEPETTEPEEATKPENTEEPEDTAASTTVTGKVSITSGWLNVRSGPGTNYGAVGSLKAGESVTITEQKTVSGKVWGRTAKGWVCMDYISVGSEDKTEAISGIVNSGSAYLRVRSAPAADSTVTAYLSHGTKVQILEKKTIDGIEWGRTDKGWVNMNYILVDGQTAPETGKSEDNTTEDNKTEEDKTITGTVKLTSGTLNVRSNAGTDNKIVGYLRNGEKVTILETKMVDNVQWGRVSNGWICMDYVKLN